MLTPEVETCSPNPQDFLDSLLRFDHMERPTCVEAMGHAYFRPVREAAAKAGATSM